MGRKQKRRKDGPAKLLILTATVNLVAALINLIAKLIEMLDR